MSTDLLEEICFLAALKTIKCVFFMFSASLLALSHATTLTISVLTWSIMASRSLELMYVIRRLWIIFSNSFEKRGRTETGL